ncbi:hypothetical protein [Chryseobacterium rhizosphaerae]|uniref:hypothetical protein n=1 Tax=Chryseobacterium rhizosphaerae TaxID=395937 RepID=UPI0006458403|nr:hypothetical protein [Chryseobacterium rhizosphaerae]MDC8101799.1 hypothetical protein [Chryseobacterium rhizosphaerae]MDR6547694.1 hypothetical protein [Chryseobacterium rhizosphaerae]
MTGLDCIDYVSNTVYQELSNATVGIYTGAEAFGKAGILPPDKFFDRIAKNQIKYNLTRENTI